MGKLHDTTGERALEFRRKGLRLVPLRGKIPLVKRWQFLDLSESDIIAFSRKTVNWGAITGDLIVADTDNEPAEVLARQLGIDSTVEVISGRGGRHRYFKAPQDAAIRSRNGLHRMHGLDIKGLGGFIVLPGSIHPETGRVYEFVPGKELRQLHELPLFNTDWLVEKRKSTKFKPKSRLQSGSSRACGIRNVRAYIRGIPSIEGQNGSNACYRVAAILLTAGYSQEEALAEMLDWEMTNASPLWGRKALMKKIADVWKRNCRKRNRRRSLVNFA